MKKTMQKLFCGFTLAVVLSFWTLGIVGAEEAANQSQTGNTQTIDANGQTNQNQEQAANPPIKPQDGNITTAANVPSQTDVPVSEVEVNANKDQKPAAQEGSTVVGYKADTATTTGPWGQKKLLDTPYSISVMSSDLIKNVQANSPEELFRINPLTQTTYPQTMNGTSAANMRGFYVLTPAVDGIRNNTAYGVFIEEIDRIEILDGLSGFLYGGGNVGGLVNYVLKRPTNTPLADVTVGNYGGSRYYVHGDFGGPLGNDEKFAYRLNVVTQNGNTVVNDQSVKRNLFSGAIDWHVTDKFLFQVEAAHSEYDQKGTAPAGWNVASGVKHPAAPDASTLYSEPWTFNNLTTNRAGANIKWDLNDNLKVRAAYQYQQDNRTLRNVSNTLQANGTYNQAPTMWAENLFTNQGYYFYVDDHFQTGSVDNKLTVGYSAYTYWNTLHQNNASNPAAFTGLTFADPYRAQPVWPVYGTLPMYTPVRQDYKNWIIGDDLKFNEKWSAMAGINHSTIHTSSAYAGSIATNYDKSANTPTLSLIYKPTSWLSTYATYMESLEQGTIVGLGYTNTGAILEPLVDKQYEVGVKANAGGVLFTGALFKINKANQYSNLATPIPTYVQDGLQVNQGIELTATGKVNDHLTLLGGVTFMSCKVENTNIPALAGKRPTNVANQMAKIYAEYSMPSVRGLTLTGGIYWTGKQYADTVNTDELPAYAIVDIGLRYETKAGGTPVIYRLNVDNVTNKSYWMNSSSVGEPRTIALSAEFKL
jgi:iron complex outermembrane receptor protein